MLVTRRTDQRAASNCTDSITQPASMPGAERCSARRCAARGRRASTGRSAWWPTTVAVSPDTWIRGDSSDTLICRALLELVALIARSCAPREPRPHPFQRREGSGPRARARTGRACAGCPHGDRAAGAPAPAARARRMESPLRRPAGGAGAGAGAGVRSQAEGAAPVGVTRRRGADLPAGARAAALLRREPARGRALRPLRLRTGPEPCSPPMWLWRSRRRRTMSAPRARRASRARTSHWRGPARRPTRRGRAPRPGPSSTRRPPLARTGRLRPSASVPRRSAATSSARGRLPARLRRICRPGRARGPTRSADRSSR